MKKKKYYLKFGKKIIKLDTDPRKHICSFCNREGITNCHHLAFSVSNAFAYSIEICAYHHRLYHSIFGKRTRTIKNEKEFIKWKSYMIDKILEKQDEIKRYLNFILGEVIKTRL